MCSNSKTSIISNYILLIGKYGKSTKIKHISFWSFTNKIIKTKIIN